ncbi:MAG TPA: hypothetical protein VN495_03390, partial [Candidatus Paceibacterota bacterium]|nr:hypothetical protein [Candidatus Paceibacterota bacterium]
MGIQQIVPAQRKDEDAAFAAARGIRVPKVFASFDEARDFVLHQGGKIIIRSEHPLEREGLSGINMSFTLDLKGLEPTAWNAYLFQNFAQITAEELDRRLQRFHREYINSSMYCKENG